MNNGLINLLIIIALLQVLTGGGRLASLLANPGWSLIYLGTLLIALVIHEFAHALTADRLGDPNPRLAGRITLNPLKHLDPLGTIMIIVAGFGWGKPVQFDPYNLQHPARDGAWIAAAGPLSNLLLATACALGLHWLPLPALVVVFLFELLQINLVLALFNLLPIYPLDGHHILRAFLPSPNRAGYDLFNRQFGYLVTLFVLFIPIGGGTIASHVLNPALEFSAQVLLPGQ